MGVYIKGMEMPKEIEPALVIEFCEDQDGKRYARFYHYRYGGLTDWHEVIELHEPHGRLGDLDVLEDMVIKEKHFCAKTAAKHEIIVELYKSFGLHDAELMIEAAPTIIPASEEDKT